MKRDIELLTLECQIFSRTIDDMMPLVFKPKRKPVRKLKPLKKDEKSER